MREVISSGILIKGGDKFLLCHPTGMKPHQGWGIPKGRVDPGESIEQTAVRETFEECGLRIPISEIKPFHETSYRSSDEEGPIRKFLKVFLYETDEDIQLKELECNSYFTPRWAKSENVKVLEVDQFRWVTLDEAKGLAMRSIKSVFDLF